MNFGGNDNGTTPTREGKNGKNISFFFEQKETKRKFFNGKKRILSNKMDFHLLRNKNAKFQTEIQFFLKSQDFHGQFDLF